ncbi:MAG: tetratricopeptide repeat protein [Blastocatellia bacterium]
MSLLVQSQSFEQTCDLIRRGDFAGAAQACLPLKAKTARRRSSITKPQARPRAIRLLREQLQRTPNDAQVSLMLAQALLQKDSSPAELKEAQTLLQKLIARQPDNARAFVTRQTLFAP